MQAWSCQEELYIEDEVTSGKRTEKRRKKENETRIPGDHLWIKLPEAYLPI